MTGTTFMTDELPGYIRRFRSLLDPGWLQVQQSLPVGRRHYLYSEIANAESLLNGGAPPSNSALFIARLVTAVETLSRNQVANLDDRLPRLTSGEISQSRATVHELLSASFYVSGGKLVEFVRESTERTPDLLVDGVQIECKFKMGGSEAERRDARIYELIWRRLGQVSKTNVGLGGVRVEIVFPATPTLDVLPVLATATRNVMLLGSRLEKTNTAPEWSWSVRFIPNLPAFRNPRVSDADLANFDFVSAESIAVDSAGTLKPNLHLLMRSDTEPDRIKSYKGSLKKAAAQVDPVAPAVVELEVTSMHSRRTERTERLRGQLRDFIPRYFRENQRISAIAFVSRTYSHATGRTTAVETREVLRNPSPRRPLPDTW